MSDKRRPDLAIPYVHRPDVQNEMPTSMIFRSLPMVAMFMRSKILAWSGLFLTLQAFLGQPLVSKPDDDSVNLSHIFTAIMGVAVSYMDFVIAPGGTKPTPAS